MVLAHNFKGSDRTQDVKISQNVTFDTMLLNESTLQGLKASGFYKPSPIQLHGIPLGKCGFDLLLEAKSGTGKTAVFTVIALEKINFNNGLQVVMLAPTREIAAQICDVIRQIGSQYPGLTVETVMGGLPVKDDIEKLTKKVHIVVGSPGRLRHLIHDKYIDTSSIRLVVLDEADKLMEKSFRPDIDYILSALPQQKQIIFSSATFPEDSKAFINQYIQVHQHICPDSNNVLLGISQKVTFVSHNTNIVRQTLHRFEELLNILSKKEFKQCLIFCNYQARVTELYKMLKKAKWPAEKLYGQQEQIDRLEALKTLQEYKCRILIATDLAARGLDSAHVDLVVNFEPPNDWQTYLHRIGRAGRFGSYGQAVTILSNQEEQKFKELLNSLQFQIDIRNFWSDEQFAYSDVTTPEDDARTSEIMDDTSESSLVSSIEVTTDENDEDLLTYEPQYEIETFDQLCLSFQEASNKVETFTELLESFQNSHIEKTEVSTTECLDIIETKNDSLNNLKMNLDSLMTSENKEQSKAFVETRSDKYEDSESENSLEQNINNSNDIKKEEDYKHHYITTMTNDKINKKHNGKTKSIQSYKRNERDETDFESEIIEDSEFENTLEPNLGASNHTEKIKNYKSPYKTARISNKMNRKSSNEIKPINYNTFEKEETSDENDDDDNESNDYGYNTASYDFKRSHCNSLNNGSSTKYNHKYQNKHKEYSNSKHHNNCYGYSQSYINWYHYLKFRTQQIEMFVYINEMSKLYNF